MELCPLARRQHLAGAAAVCQEEEQGGWGQGVRVVAGGDRVGRWSGHESGPGLRLWEHGRASRRSNESCPLLTSLHFFLNFFILKEKFQNSTESSRPLTQLLLDSNIFTPQAFIKPGG